MLQKCYGNPPQNMYLEACREHSHMQPFYFDFVLITVISARQHQINIFEGTGMAQKRFTVLRKFYHSFLNLKIFEDKLSN